MKEKSEHLVESKVRWDERQRQRVALEEKARRNVQDADHVDDHCWTEACEGVAKRMLKCLQDSDVTKDKSRLQANRVSVLCALRGK